METIENTFGNTAGSKSYLLEGEMSELLELAKKAVAPNSRLRGQGQIALTLSERGFGVRPIARFLSAHGLPVSPAAVSKYLTAERSANAAPVDSPAKPADIKQNAKH
jgi:hypothetical protein